MGFDNFHGEGLYRGGLLTHRVLYNPHLHIAKNFVSLVNALLPGQNSLPAAKMVVSDEEIRLPLVASSPEELAVVRRSNPCPGALLRPGPPPPGADQPQCQRTAAAAPLDAERYVELIQRIVAEDNDLLVLVTGAPGEREEAAAMCARTGGDRCVNFAGALTLRQLPALYTLARLMVTNDSGPGPFRRGHPHAPPLSSSDRKHPPCMRAAGQHHADLCRPGLLALRQRRQPPQDTLRRQVPAGHHRRPGVRAGAPAAPSFPAP